MTIGLLSNGFNLIDRAFNLSTWYLMSCKTNDSLKMTSQKPWEPNAYSLIVCKARKFFLVSEVKYYTLPTSLQSIGMWGFSTCASLKSITLPDSLRSIGENAFPGCSSITSISFPAALQSIGKGAFYGCDSLAEMDVSKITLSLTNATDWPNIVNNSKYQTGSSRITKVICRREQADKMREAFTNAALEFVDWKKLMLADGRFFLLSGLPPEQGYAIWCRTLNTFSFFWPRFVVFEGGEMLASCIAAIEELGIEDTRQPGNVWRECLGYKRSMIQSNISETTCHGLLTTFPIIPIGPFLTTLSKRFFWW